MKKIKLLTPFLSAITLTGTLVPLTACKNSSKEETKENVELDTTKCSAEQTTDANITMNTYVFNVKNFDESKQELTAEIEKAESEDSVSIEITSTEYNSTEKKFYVYVTTSKEDGTLNDNESVKFSIKFKCLNKETQEVIWEKSIDSLVVKHVESEEDDGQHFIDTDVNKVFTTSTTGEQTIEMTFPVGDLGKWTNKDVTDMYNIANLSVSVYQSDLAKLSKITIGDVTTEWVTSEIESVTVYTDLKVSIKINVPENIQDTTTSYNLYFEYSSPEMLVKDTWRQTIGGFKVNYDHHYEGDHSELACSRNRYFYKEMSSETETATNYVVVRLLDDYAASYKASDFTVSSSNENVVIGTDLITYKLQDPVHTTTYYYYLAIPYSIKQEEHSWFEPKDQFNVTLTITSTASGNEWTEEHKGFSFFNRIDFSNKSLVWYQVIGRHQEDPLKKLTAGDKKEVVDCFHSISPIDLSYIVLTDVSCDGIEDIDFEVEELNWEVSKVNVTIPADTEAGTYDIYYTIMVATDSCAYKYTLKVSTEVSAAE